MGSDIVFIDCSDGCIECSIVGSVGRMLVFLYGIYHRVSNGPCHAS